MLATEEKKLHWMGIDLHARWRRRVAVVVTYVCLVPLIGVCGIDSLAAHPVWAFWAMVLLTSLFLWVSVLGDGRLVKSFGNAPLRKIGKKYLMVGSLDDWARYRYSVADFESASKEQQTQLLNKYRVGNYLVPAKPMEDPRLDERERRERDTVSRWALGQVALYLAIYAGATAVAKHPLPPVEAASYLWSFSILARTLPQARVLWTEPDPRQAGDLRLAESEV